MILRVGSTCLLASVVVLGGCTSESTRHRPLRNAHRQCQARSRAPSRSPRERAQQLTALSPEQFDALYRLNTRVRVPTPRFADQRGQGRAVSSPAASVDPQGPHGSARERPSRCRSRQAEDGTRRQGASWSPRHPSASPTLRPSGAAALPQCHAGRLAGGKQLTVHRDGTWRAPDGLGPSECFTVRGRARQRHLLLPVETGSDDRPARACDVSEWKTRAASGAAGPAGGPLPSPGATYPAADQRLGLSRSIETGVRHGRVEGTQRRARR